MKRYQWNECAKHTLSVIFEWLRLAFTASLPSFVRDKNLRVARLVASELGHCNARLARAHDSSVPAWLSSI